MSKITTKVDDLINIVKKRKEVQLSDLAKELGADRAHVEEWARILDDQNIVRLVYPTNPLSDMYLREVTEEEKATGRRVFRVEKIRPVPKNIFERPERMPEEERVFIRLAGKMVPEAPKAGKKKKEVTAVVEASKKPAAAGESLFHRLRERLHKPGPAAKARPAKRQKPAEKPGPARLSAPAKKGKRTSLIRAIDEALPRIRLPKRRKERPPAPAGPEKTEPARAPAKGAKRKKAEKRRVPRHVMRKRIRHAAKKHRKLRARRMSLLQSLIRTIMRRKR